MYDFFNQAFGAEKPELDPILPPGVCVQYVFAAGPGSVIKDFLGEFVRWTIYGRQVPLSLAGKTF